MFKKLIVLGGAGIALLALAIPSLAYGSFYSRPNENEVEINTTTTAEAYTGGNSQSNVVSVSKASDIMAFLGGSGSRYIQTGDATANASTLTIANTNPCGCRSCCFTRTENEAEVDSTVGAIADTGLNAQDNGVEVTMAHDVLASSMNFGGSTDIRTGEASSTARNTNLINVRTFGFGR